MTREDLHRALFRPLAKVQLEPGDIVFVRGDGFVSNAILRLTRRRGEGPSWVSHVAIVDVGGPLLTAELLEAVGRVRRTTIRDSYLGRDCAIAVARPRGLTERDREVLLAEVRRYEGRAYGWGKLALHFLDAALAGGREVFRRLSNDRWPICSWLVARGYAALGWTFGANVTVAGAQPDDIWDYCAEHPEKYAWPTGRRRLWHLEFWPLP